MALTADELAAVRTEIGEADPPSDSDLDDIHDRVGGVVGVVRAVWASKLAALLALPATFSVSGEYSQSTGDNIKAIQQRLGELSGLPDDSDDLPPMGNTMASIEVIQLVRDGDCGR